MPRHGGGQSVSCDVLALMSSFAIVIRAQAVRIQVIRTILFPAVIVRHSTLIPLQCATSQVIVHQQPLFTRPTLLFHHIRHLLRRLLHPLPLFRLRVTV